MFSPTSGSVIIPIGFTLDTHLGHERASMLMLCFISVAQSTEHVELVLRRRRVFVGA